MSRYTEEQIEAVMKYKAQKSTTTADDEQMNLKSIISMSDDLIKTIKNQQKHLWTNQKKIVVKNNKNRILPNHDRHCYTERKNSPQNNMANSDGFSEFDDSQQQSVNHGGNLMKGIQRFKFLELNDLEKSEYIPMRKNLNPQQGTPIKKQAENKKLFNNRNKVTKEQMKTNNLHIQVDNHTPKTNKQKSRILTQTKSSLTLTTPIKHFKKHILEAVEIKKQAEQRKYCQTPKHNSIKQFYTQNNDHIPLYEKSKILSAKKLISMQESRMIQESVQVEDVTFWPMINSKSDKLIDGKSFYSRLEETISRKQENQARIIYETMKPCTFAPKLNANKLVESKVRKIWNQENSKVDFESVIRQQDEYEIQRQDFEDRNWMTIKLGKQFASKLFID